MAQHPASRLAGLPGYDTAPDIYETPDLPDSQDANTVSTRSPSPSADSQTTRETDDEEEEDDEIAGIVNRKRLHAARARRRFVGEGKGAQTRTGDGGRSRPGLPYGGEEDDESLEARIARLRREVEECQAEAARMAKEEDGGESGGLKKDDLDGLGRLLAVLDASALDRRKGGQRGKSVVAETSTDGTGGDGNGVDLTDDQTLQKVVDFDSRLSALEAALGLSSLDPATADATSMLPVLPSLTLLDQQMSAISSAGSLANLEAASARLHKLRNEVERMPSSRGTINGDADENEESLSMSTDDMDNLNKLYTLLPTLQSLTPTVHALLTRLRSLRTLHTTAASAVSSLEDVEKRQAEMDGELKAWREGLDRVEQAVKSALESNGRNGMMVQGWVGELEARMKALGR